MCFEEECVEVMKRGEIPKNKNRILSHDDQKLSRRKENCTEKKKKKKKIDQYSSDVHVDDFFPMGIGMARTGIRLFVVMVVVAASDAEVETGEAMTSFETDRRREILLLEEVGVSERMQGIDA